MSVLTAIPGLYLENTEQSPPSGRLAILLELNREIVRRNSLYASDRERRTAEMMLGPVTSIRAYKLLGLLLGSFCPTAILGAILSNSSGVSIDNIPIIGLFVMATAVTAAFGCWSGKFVAKSLAAFDKYSITARLLMIPLLGFVWGMASGAVGGAVLFLVGSIVGGAIGALVGMVGLSTFYFPHRLLRSGDVIERRQLFPLAFGITLTICAFILGL
jgi:hypothetical protein